MSHHKGKNQNIFKEFNQLVMKILEIMVEIQGISFIETKKIREFMLINDPKMAEFF